LHSSIFYVNHTFLSSAKRKAVPEYNQGILHYKRTPMPRMASRKAYEMNESQSFLDLSSLELGNFHPHLDIAVPEGGC
jgi:hypothetical protein